MHCYCANYYGAVNCHNKVSQFGERCKLCTVMNEGRASQYEATSASHAYYDTSSSRDSSREDQRGRGRERTVKDSKKSRHHS